ncbi:MAG: DUF2911 domain-containing protein [Chthoniobacterales bacterium]
MKTLISQLLVLPTLLALVSPLLADEKPRVSPHEKVTANVDGNEMIIVYGRPYTKDPKSGAPRKIWGGLVPYGKVWRMGADEATLLTTDKEIEMGGKSIAPGTYSLFLLPDEGDGAKLIVNKQTGQWGTKYDEAQDLARVDLKKGTTANPVDQFTIAIEKNDGSGGELRLSWESTSYFSLFSVKK